MHDSFRKAARDPDAAWELARMDKDPQEVVEAVSGLDRSQATALGMNFKWFPIGCDLTEILVGTCASDLEKTDILGNCMLADAIGASIHVCAYAFADIAEAYGMKGIDLYREVRELTGVPLDLDHFGRYGPMRLPKEIVGCPGECYHSGPPFSGCPRDRIHSRLLEKEKDAISDREEWVKVSSSVAVNVTCAQGGEGHAAPLEEAREVADLARKHGKGVEAIMFVGDGYEDLISGFNAALDLGADVFVVEGGPFNRAKDRLDAFARAVAAARVLAPGKVVATNGAYEDECRIGLRAGLNAIITGFPKNHHGYMCGYSPGTARRGNFGLPRVLRIISEEVSGGLTRAPIRREELIALARAVKVVGPENVYPAKVGCTPVGDAHWVCLRSTPLYQEVTVERTVRDIAAMARGGELGGTVALLGGRFVSWVVARELDGHVDRIVISDADPLVEKATLLNLRPAIKTELIAGGSNDRVAGEDADTSVICSTVPAICEKIARQVSKPVTFI